MNVDKAVRYHRIRRRIAVAATALSAATLCGLFLTAASAQLRSAAASAAPADDPASPISIALYVVMLSAILQAVRLPLAFFSGHVLERRYGLSTESAPGWLRDQAKGALLSIVLAVPAAECLYFAIRRWPTWWWLAAAAAFGAVMLVIARLAPVLLLPLFYRFRPLERPLLHERLRALSARAGLPVLGVFEWALGEKSRRANAALVGMGSTRRILLSDTLLEDYSDDEIEVILAHELAHHAHGDVTIALVAQTAVLAAGFAAAAASFALAGSALPGGIDGAADVAGLPLILLVSGAVSVALGPVIHAMSRRHERRADAYALRLTNGPAAFISAMRRLGAQNLAEPHPSRAAVWLFHSHPPVEERIALARRIDESERYQMKEGQQEDVHRGIGLPLGPNS